MKLFSFWRSLATYRVRIAMNLKGLKPDEIVEINLMKGQQREEAFRKVNPMMAIPALVDGDGPALFESLAIIEYLDETHPNPPLLPKDPKGRARVRGLAQLVAADSHPLIVPRVREYLAARVQARRGHRHEMGAALAPRRAHRARDPSQGQGDRQIRPRRPDHRRRHLPRQPGGGRGLLQGRSRRRSRTSSASSTLPCRTTRSRGRIRSSSPARRRRCKDQDAARVLPARRPHWIDRGRNGLRPDVLDAGELGLEIFEKDAGLAPPACAALGRSPRIPHERRIDDRVDRPGRRPPISSKQMSRAAPPPIPSTRRTPVCLSWHPSRSCRSMATPWV